MNASFINSLKNSSRLSMMVTVVFFVGVLVSVFLLSTLPHALVINGGLPTLELAWPILVRLFVAIGLTFLAGIAALNFSLQSKKETVVYLEKKNEATSQEGSHETETDGTNFSSVTEALNQKGTEKEILQQALNALCQQVQAGQGAFYGVGNADGKKNLELTIGFAVVLGEQSAIRFDWGEGLIGQVAAGGKSLYLDEVPEGYIVILSGLGSSSPRYVFMTPLISKGEVKGVIELALFSPLSESRRRQIEEIGKAMADKIN
jgi:GAF domain